MTAGPGLCSKYTEFFEAFFPKIDGIAREMEAGLQGIMLAPPKHFFFHAPDSDLWIYAWLLTQWTTRQLDITHTANAGKYLLN